jgi:DNA polymerase-4
MPLRYLFIDMNAYFASVEQHLNPALRGKPVAVVPVMADTSSCIAASYEAKAFGIKTGTPVREAKQRCPGIILVEGRHRAYIEIHRELLAAIETIMHVERVASIDEMVCKLLGVEREAIRARHLAQQIKAAIARRVGPALRCSIGLGPNVLLAKVAADMQKPDGLTAIEVEELPGKLHKLQLEDLPGIGPRMRRRLNKQGILTVQQLCQLADRQLSNAWGSHVLGQRWFHALRGDEIEEIAIRRGSVGHSHVLPPNLRNEKDGWSVLQRMLYKAAMRLRDDQLKARSVTVTISYLGRESWTARRRIDPVGDTPTLLRVTQGLFQKKPAGKILKVGVVLGNVVEAGQIPDHLFPEDRNLLALSRAMDAVNHKFGMQAAYFGGLHGFLHRAPMRIAFNRIPKPELEAMGEGPPRVSTWSGLPGGIRRAEKPALRPDRPTLTYQRDEFADACGEDELA